MLRGSGEERDSKRAAATARYGHSDQPAFLGGGPLSTRRPPYFSPCTTCHAHARVSGMHTCVHSACTCACACTGCMLESMPCTYLRRQLRRQPLDGRRRLPPSLGRPPRILVAAGAAARGQQREASVYGMCYRTRRVRDGIWVRDRVRATSRTRARACWQTRRRPTRCRACSQ